MIEFLMWAGGILATGIFALVGWAWRQHGKDIDMITNEIKLVGAKHEKFENRFEEHRLYAAETYAKKTEVEKGFDKLETILDRIDQKLDRKIDKTNV
jgi:hypothetical protein